MWAVYQDHFRNALTKATCHKDMAFVEILTKRDQMQVLYVWTIHNLGMWRWLATHRPISITQLWFYWFGWSVYKKKSKALFFFFLMWHQHSPQHAVLLFKKTDTHFYVLTVSSLKINICWESVVLDKHTHFFIHSTCCRNRLKKKKKSEGGNANY